MTAHYKLRFLFFTYFTASMKLLELYHYNILVSQHLKKKEIDF
jgi:hypothetical protein